MLCNMVSEVIWGGRTQRSNLPRRWAPASQLSLQVSHASRTPVCHIVNKLHIPKALDVCWGTSPPGPPCAEVWPGLPLR